MQKKVIIIGAGPSGIGVAAVLKKMRIPFIILERKDVGASFLGWPEEMRFISPSFTGNFFGMPDLNAVTPDSSPAYTLKTEHPTGSEYATYLSAVAKYYKLPIKTNCDVLGLKKTTNLFHVETSRGFYKASYVIWAAGEFQYPNEKPFVGANFCTHNSRIPSWKDMVGDFFVVIGGYESGIDAACQLASLGKKVLVLDRGDEKSIEKSDSSYSLSPFTRDRLEKYRPSITIRTHSEVISVEQKKEGGYLVHLSGGDSVETNTRPILGTGFISSLGMVEDMFVKKDDHVLLTDSDESTKTPGLFLVGPQVRHGAAIFCFIYKYRQRFAVVAETIARRLGKEGKIEQVLEEYKKMNFYLNDLSCCEDECPC